MHKQRLCILSSGISPYLLKTHNAGLFLAQFWGEIIHAVTEILYKNVYQKNHTKIATDRSIRQGARTLFGELKW